MELLEPDKSRVRVHMGVPVLGVQDSGFALGYRFANVMGLLEFRMNRLQPHEYARITGTPTAAVAFTGSVVAGNTITATVGALAAFTYTVTSSDALNADPVLTALTNFSNAFNQANGTQYIAFPQPSVVAPQSLIGASPRQWQLAFVTTGTTAFTVSVTATGSLAPYVALQGVVPKPSMTFKDGTTATGYLNVCDYLESAIATASDQMKYTRADVVEYRQNQPQARQALYLMWCNKLADYLGIPRKPMQGVGRYGGSGTGLVV